MKKYSYVEQELTDPDRDLPKDRMITLKNNILHIKQEGMYGFWFINFDKGQVPEHLKGAYMSAEEAKKAAFHYLGTKGRLDDVVNG